MSSELVEILENLEKKAQEIVSKTTNSRTILTREYREFQKEKDQFEKEVGIENYHVKGTIELNVGGRVFTTKVATLEKAEGTLLGTMFCGRYDPGPKDMEGRYFLDRSPKYFEVILNALRTEKPLVIPEDEGEREALLREVRFYEMEMYFKKYLKTPTWNGSGTLLQQKHFSDLNSWIEGEGDWNLLYCGTKHGFTASSFHSKCNNQGETLTVVKSENGYIFGGYTPIPWQSRGGPAYDPKTFLFSFVNKVGKTLKFSNTGPNVGGVSSIYDISTALPSFGGGCDLFLGSNCHNNTQSYSQLGHSFILENDSTPLINILTDSYNFKVKEIEVYARKTK